MWQLHLWQLANSNCDKTQTENITTKKLKLCQLIRRRKKSFDNSNFFCHSLRFWILSNLSYATIWVWPHFDFCHILSFVPFSFFELCHIFSFEFGLLFSFFLVLSYFLVLSLFEILSSVTFSFLSHFKSLSFVTFKVFELCHI